MKKKNHRLDDYFIEYQEIITRNVYWYLQDYYMAEDICQESFVRLVKYMEQIPPDQVKPWLLTVSKHLTLDYMRKGGQYRTTVGLPPAEEEIPDDLYTDLSELMVRVEEQERRLRVLKRLEQERPKWYNVILMSYLEDMDNRSIGKAMGVRAYLISKWKGRATEWLREMYRKEEERDS